MNLYNPNIGEMNTKMSAEKRKELVEKGYVQYMQEKKRKKLMGKI